MMNAKRMLMAGLPGWQRKAVVPRLLKQVIVVTAATLFTTVTAAPPDNSKINWKMDCAMCHGANGKGNTPAGRHLGAPNYQDPTVQASFTDDEAFKDIKEGLRKDGRMKMKSFAGELTDLDIRELVQYIRSLKKGQ